MRLPSFTQTATIISPATVETPRGNTELVYTVPPATQAVYKSWLQQDSTADLPEDGRDPKARTWTLIARMPDVVFEGNEKVLTLGMTFTIFGVPEPCYTLRGGYHHTEMKLKWSDG
jgi:hypothetical protein